MKNVIITIAVIVGIYILLATFGDGDRISSVDNDRIYELNGCLEEYKSAYEEQKDAMDEAYSILSYWGGGDSENEELIDAINESAHKIDDTGLVHKISLECSD
ncbi:MAG: hypothetical protein ACMG6E_02745 [Candidatus Roizmanbacteria bacterium]